MRQFGAMSGGSSSAGFRTHSSTCWMIPMSWSSPAYMKGEVQILGRAAEIRGIPVRPRPSGSSSRSGSSRTIAEVRNTPVITMVKPPQRPPDPRGRLGNAQKVRKEFWLDPKALRRAQKLLGAETERETVEIALDLVAFLIPAFR